MGGGGGGTGGGTGGRWKGREGEFWAPKNLLTGYTTVVVSTGIGRILYK